VKQRVLLLSWLGALLFLSGVLAALGISGAFAWGETEARVYSSFSGDARLRLKCPLMLSPDESGVIRAEIINLIDKNIEPVITAQISHRKVPREIKQTLPLAPLESKTLEWNVDSSDVIFERLILVNVFQSRYSDNPSRLGSCGILLFNLFGLTGKQMFTLVVAVSLILMLAGGLLWLYARRPLNQFSGNIVRINSVLFSITILALLSTVAHWWGLALFFDALILLMMGVILTEFVLFSQRHRE